MAILGQEKKNNNFQLNASNAAISGFSLFGKNHTYLIDENGNFNKDKLIEFANKFKNEKKLYLVSHLIFINILSKICQVKKLIYQIQYCFMVEVGKNLKDIK